MRFIILIFLFVIGNLVHAQQDKNMLLGAIGANLSFTDASSAPGYGLLCGWQHKAESNLGLGAELMVDRVFGGASVFLPQPAKGYSFATTVVSLLPTVDYSLYLLRFNQLEVKPSVGVGLLFSSAKGTFSLPPEAISMYKQWGEPYFYPVYNSNGQIVDAVGKANTVALAILPGFSLAYYVTPQLKIFGRVGYLMAQTDDLDAFNLPAAANKGRDIVQVNHLGFGYQLYRKKFY